MTEETETLERAEQWLRQCRTWLLENDLGMQCPMEADPLDLAGGLVALRFQLDERGWRTDIDNAPQDETLIEGLYPDGAVDHIFWREEGRHCVLGPRNGSYPAGWCSREADNLPVEDPLCWRHLPDPPAQTGESE